MARKARFANNASSRLAANLSSIGTTCSVTPGEGAKFPTLSAGQFFMATLVKADGTKEVVKVTARATDTFTIVRAAEPVGSVQVASAFSAGDRIELRMTAVALGDELDRLDLAAIARVSNKSANYTVLAADLNTLFRVDTSGGARTISLPSIAATGDEFKVLVAKVTNDGNLVTIAANGSDTINGLSTLSLTQQWAGAWLIADKATNTWTAINSGSSSGNWVIDTFTGSGTDGPFTLSGDPGSKNNTMVWVGGVYQNKASYTLVGTDLTLGGTVASGVPIEVAWAAPIAFGVPNDGSVTTAKIGDGAVTTPKLGDGSVSNAKLAALAVSTAKIADDAVTFDKLQNIATARLLGRASAGAGNAEELTGAQAAFLLTDKLQPLDATVAANALTITLNPTTLDFRSTTLGSGAVNTRQVSAPISLVVSSGSTLGTGNGILARLAVLAIDNAGTVELAVVNAAGGVNLDEAGLISTTAEGGAGAADSVSTIYSTTARTNVPYRIVGFIESTQATAGTWATAPSLVSSADPLAKWVNGYGQSLQNVIGSRANGVTYTNTTGRTIVAYIRGTIGAGTEGTAGINATAVWGQFAQTAATVATAVLSIPPGATYSTSGFTISSWFEIR